MSVDNVTDMKSSEMSRVVDLDFADTVFINDDYVVEEILQILNCYILVPVCIVGLLSNIGALLIFNRPPRVMSGVSVYLNALLITDIVQLFGTALSTTPYFCESALSDPQVSGHEICIFYYRYIGLLLARLIAVVDTGQAWTLTALSVHRYWKISRPMTSRASDTPAKSAKFIGVLLALNVLFRTPMFYELRIVQHPQLNISVVEENLHVGRNRHYNIVYYLVLNTLFYNVIPFTVMLFTTVFTLKSIVYSRRHLHVPLVDTGKGAAGSSSSTTTPGRFVKITKSTRRKMNEIRATFSVSLMTALFLLFHSLFVYEVVERYRLYFVKIPARPIATTGVDHVIVEFNTLLAVVSSTLNAFVYIAFMTRCKIFLKYKFKSIQSTATVVATSRNRLRTLSSSLEKENDHVCVKKSSSGGGESKNATNSLLPSSTASNATANIRRQCSSVTMCSTVF